MKKICTIVLSLLILIMPLSACKKPDDNIVKIKLNEVTHSIFYAPMYIAIEKGYFLEEGLKIELSNGGGADNVMTALLSSNADIGLMGAESCLYVYLQNKTDYPIVFGQLTQKDGSFLVGRKAEPNFKWEDLAGKEVLSGRPGGVPAMTFEYLVNQHKLTDGVNITLNTAVKFDLMTTAFKNGTGDYCTMFEPIASEFEANGNGFKIASVGVGAGDVPYTSFIAKQSYIKNNTKVINSFLKAIKKAYEYMKIADLSELATTLVGQFPAISLNSIKASIISYQEIDAWSNNLQMSEDSFNRLQDIMINAGELKSKVEISKIVDNSYAQAIFK